MIKTSEILRVVRRGAVLLALIIHTDNTHNDHW